MDLYDSSPPYNRKVRKASWKKKMISNVKESERAPNAYPMHFQRVNINHQKTFVNITIVGEKLSVNCRQIFP